MTIPNSKLAEGIELCKKQSKMLLDSSNILYEKRKYVTSIGLSILAKEELTKIRIFNRMQIRNLPIEHNLWKILNDHRVKLGLPYYLSYLSLRRRSPLDIVKIRNMYLKEGIDPKMNAVDLVKPLNVKGLKLLESLDLLKQDCHFLNWIDNDWFSILGNYDENTQKAIAHILYTEYFTDYLGILLGLKYKSGDKFEIPHTITGNKFRKVIKYMESKDFIKMQTLAYQVILRDYEKRYQEILNGFSKRKKKKVSIPI
ncbi:MAG: AbiV family abortive infection protein [Nitrosarchaeum sp.]